MSRLFFAMRAKLPFFEIPFGRSLVEKDRHLTLTFLGEKKKDEILSQMQKLPLPFNLLSPSARCDEILFLSNVVALNVKFFTDLACVLSIKRDLDSLFEIDEAQTWLPHITVARAPFDIMGYQKLKINLPALFSSFHLYESKGSLAYDPIWSFEFLEPFEIVSHTADLAFKIRGETFSDLFHSAALAICFQYPHLFKFYEKKECTNLEEVIERLNQFITLCDIEIGSQIKAVSHSSNIALENKIYTWEMILDL
jgi:2'-5' RNA ligase